MYGAKMSRLTLRMHPSQQLCNGLTRLRERAGGRRYTPQSKQTTRLARSSNFYPKRKENSTQGVGTRPCDRNGVRAAPSSRPYKTQHHMVTAVRPARSPCEHEQQCDLCPTSNPPFQPILKLVVSSSTKRAFSMVV